MRIECPTCKTSYTEERCGIPKLQESQSAIVTVKCLVCASDFDTRVTPKIIVVLPGWFQRTILRQQPTTQQDGHEAVAIVR